MTMIITMGMIGAIIPMVGLAIDASLLYATKAKLSAATDAGALAGARSLNRGMDLASQTTSATATAEAFFDANFPDGHLMTTHRVRTVTVAETTFRTRTVRMDTSVEAPTFFMRFLRLTSTTVRAEGVASRRDVNVVLVLDRSSSLQTAGVCGNMRAAAKSFVDKFSEGRDRVGLLTFGLSSQVDFVPATNFKTASPSVNTLIDSIACSGNTGTAQALWQGYQQLVTINEPGSLNLLVLFTDGVPNGITASYPVKRVTDTRYDYLHPSTSVSVPPSTCKDSAGRQYPNAAWNPANKVGALAQWANGATYGDTVGMINYQATSISNSNEIAIPDANACAYGPAGSTTNVKKTRNDIAWIPTLDLYGNATTGYKAVTTFPTGHPYVGQLRPDLPASLVRASTNAADNAAFRVRQNTSLGVVVYTIGLGGTSSEPADHDFMRRLSNDLDSSCYDATRPIGFYVYAPTTAELADAFAQVASEILRLAL